MKPILLHYYITNRCNSKCRFCDIWSETPKYDVKKSDVLVNLHNARATGCKFVDFTGGEPLLHPDLPYFLENAKKTGFITSVTTNCILFPSRIKELTKTIDLLHFSLDADTPQLHDEIRGSTSFEYVMESIPLALKAGMVPDLLFTYTNYNIDTFPGVYEIARKNRVIAILDPVFSITGADPVSEKTHQKALLFAQKPGVYLNKAHLTLRKIGGNHIRQPLCRAVRSTIVITPDNCRVLPCYHHRMNSIPISTGADAFSERNNTAVLSARLNEGRHSFCEGCSINCYFDPSYNYVFNRLFFQSLTSKLLYIIMKYLVYRHFRALLRLYYARTLFF